jgi:hypothetical protein
VPRGPQQRFTICQALASLQGRISQGWDKSKRPCNCGIGIAVKHSLPHSPKLHTKRQRQQSILHFLDVLASGNSYRARKRANPTATRQLGFDFLQYLLCPRFSFAVCALTGRFAAMFCDASILFPVEPVCTLASCHWRNEASALSELGGRLECTTVHARLPPRQRSGLWSNSVRRCTPGLLLSETACGPDRSGPARSTFIPVEHQDRAIGAQVSVAELERCSKCGYSDHRWHSPN